MGNNYVLADGETVKDVTFIYGQKSPVRDQVVFFIEL
jgi:hypothetical protein